MSIKGLSFRERKIVIRHLSPKMGKMLANGFFALDVTFVISVKSECVFFVLCLFLM